MTRVPNTCTQHGADRFERRDPLPQVPFAFDDAESLPALNEALAWTLLAAGLIGVCYLFLWVA